jgi:hypothetical protein
VTSYEGRHAEAEDSTSAEERTVEPAGGVRLMERPAALSGEVRLSSKSGAVRKLRKGPILMTQGLTSQGMQ